MIPSHNWFIATTVTNQTDVFLTHVNVIHQRPRLRRSHNFIPSEISRLDGCCRRTPSWFSVVFRIGTNIYLCAHAFLNDFWCIKNSQKHGGTFKCNAEVRVRQKTILVKFSMIPQVQNTGFVTPDSKRDRVHRRFQSDPAAKASELAVWSPSRLR